MKKMTAYILLALAVNAYAEVEVAKSAGSFLLVTPAEQMPLPLPPGELNKIQQSNAISAANSGVESSPERIKNFLIHYNSFKNAAEIRNKSTGIHEENVPAVHKNLHAIKLGFKAANFPHGTLLFATSAGTQINGAWTGLERFFEIEGGGLARLTEYELSFTNGRFYMLKSAINTQINGNQAISKIYSDEAGQPLEEVVWMVGSRFYTLSFLPYLTEGKVGGNQKMAANIGAVTLANAIN